MKRNTIAFLSAFALLLLSPSFAFAHAVVKPSEVKIAQYQTFVLGVPNEKPVATTMVRLVIPKGVTNVSPNVKPGWKITLKKDGEGEDATVSEITWSGGSIPAEMRDEFSFSAKTPSNAMTISWNVYQTYQDGVTVSWDKESGSDEEGGTSGPASRTNVNNDLKSPTPAPGSVGDQSASSRKPAFFSLLALAVSAVAFVKASGKK